MSAGLAGWAATATIASGLLMALVLLIRVPVRRAFGPQVAYALWALPLLRLLLPPLPAAWWAGAANPIERAGDVLVLIVPSDMAATTAWSWPSLATVLIAIWLVGAAAFLLFHIARHVAFCRRIKARAVSIEQVAGAWVVVSDGASGPLAFGIWRRYVAFPIDVADRYDADERALALAHELSHHQHGDLIANWAALGVLAIHWFNPVAWYAFRAFRADQELANDARVLAGRSAADRHIYACAIVKAAHGGAVSTACHLHTVANLKGRLKMLATSSTSRRRLASGSVAVAALLVAGLGLTASGSSAAAIGTTVEQAVAAPAVPPTPPVPGASSAEPAPVTPGAHQVRHVVVVRDGKTTHYDKADIDAHLAAGDRVSIAPLDPDSRRIIVKADGDPDLHIEVQDIPSVRSAKCGIGTSKPVSMLVENGKGPKRMIVICTDRIRRATADAMVTMSNPKDIERAAYAHALNGLFDARTKVVADVGVADADRTRALAAIDASIGEMKGQLARFN